MSAPHATPFRDMAPLAKVVFVVSVAAVCLGTVAVAAAVIGVVLIVLGLLGHGVAAAWS